MRPYPTFKQSVLHSQKPFHGAVLCVIPAFNILFFNVEPFASMNGLINQKWSEIDTESKCVYSFEIYIFEASGLTIIHSQSRLYRSRRL